MISDFFIAAYQKHLDMTSFGAGDTHDSKQLYVHTLEDFESITSLAPKCKRKHEKYRQQHGRLYFTAT
jgi:hypothetical protein